VVVTVAAAEVAAMAQGFTQGLSHPTHLLHRHRRQQIPVAPPFSVTTPPPLCRPCHYTTTTHLLSRTLSPRRKLISSLYTCIYTRVYTHVCVCVCIYMCVRTHTYIYICVYVYACVEVWVCDHPTHPAQPRRPFTHPFYIRIYIYIYIYIVHVHVLYCRCCRVPFPTHPQPPSPYMASPVIPNSNTSTTRTLATDVDKAQPEVAAVIPVPARLWV